jgi:DNA-binding GntR family transcriptional regulator
MTTTEETLRQKAYNIIQGKLLDGELRAGNVVSEQALAQEIGMSRTPVREAIGQLQLEGLFDKTPRVGTTVRLPSRRDLEDLYGVREAIEGYASGVSADRLNAEDDATMGRLHQELLAINDEVRARGLEFLDEPLLRRFFHADIGFHFLIVRATGNKRALAIVSEFRVIQRVFEYERVAHGPRILESAVRQHGEIRAALSRGDSIAAREAMAVHIRASRDYALEAFDRRSTGSSLTPPETLALPDDLSRHIEALGTS